MTTPREKAAHFIHKQAVIALVEKLGGKCVSCGSTEGLELDHIVPILLDGPAETLANLQVLCHKCHRKKTHHDLQKPESKVAMLKRSLDSGRLPQIEGEAVCKVCGMVGSIQLLPSSSRTAAYYIVHPSEQDAHERRHYLGRDTSEVITRVDEATALRQIKSLFMFTVQPSTQMSLPKPTSSIQTIAKSLGVKVKESGISIRRHNLLGMVSRERDSTHDDLLHVELICPVCGRQGHLSQKLISRCGRAYYYWFVWHNPMPQSKTWCYLGRNLPVGIGGLPNKS